MTKSFSIHRFLKKLVYLTLAYFCASPILTHAGGIFIEKNEVVFDNSPGKTTFSAQVPIDMDFKFDGFRYAGKPHSYVIFKLYKRANLKKELVGFFASEIELRSNRARARFLVPDTDSSYIISWIVTAYFSNEKLTSALFGGFLDGADVAEIDRFYRDPANHGYEQTLINIKASAGRREFNSGQDLSIYLQNPTRVKSQLDAGLPPVFQWEVGADSNSNAESIEYSYRLHPVEDWTAYTDSKQTTYQFLRPGSYIFEVKAKYSLAGVQKFSSSASYSFAVYNQIFGMTKGDVLFADKSAPSTAFYEIDHYASSRALVIGVTNYEDRENFASLPYVANDVTEVGAALEALNFTDLRTPTDTSRKTIISEFESLLARATKNDRIVVYFSGHGTSIGDQGFLVPSDCLVSIKKESCISFDYLKSWIEKMMTEKKVKHLLVVLDSCQSGLGVLSKTSKRSPIEVLAGYPSAHMITAGLADQNAYIDTSSKMSIFTKFLVKGLREKSADYTGDNILSLTELLVYVQDNVSKFAAEEYDMEQTPVMGKIKGAGEMIFLLDSEGINQ